MIPTFPIRLVLFLCIVLSSGWAETVKDREGAVRGDKAKMETNERWIYNNLDAGFAEAKHSGKPLLVVLRCVPCLACMGIDTEVLVENKELTPLLDQFVRVRLINANTLPLDKFQFDYDLSFTTLFFNGDGTVYGRYGSWAHQRDPQKKATQSFRHALAGALKIHRAYPAVNDALAGKQSKPMAFRRPVDMPHIKGKYQEELNWSGKVVQSCVHCHQIGDSQRMEIRTRPKLEMPLRLIYPHPDPATIGFELTPDMRVKVVKGSIAASAGFQDGEQLLMLDGQPIISVADISWALHHAPDDGAELSVVTADASGQRHNRSLKLPAQWRAQSDISRRVGTWPMRAMAFGGMKLEDAGPEHRSKHGIAPESLALLAKHVGQYGKHARAKKEGWRKGDILIELDGSDKRFTESQLVGHLLRERKAGENVPAVILRNGERKNLVIPTQ